MRCDSCREHLSADLDGQADPLALAEALEHRDGCPDCQAWYSTAAEVNRLVRLAPAASAPAVPEARLDAILAELPAPGRDRTRRTVHRAARIGLGLTGVLQAGWGVLALLNDQPGMSPNPTASSGNMASEMTSGAGMDAGMGMVHMTHEYSSWVIALGVAFVVGAVYIRHLAGVLPALGCFLALLTVVSAADLLAHDVNPAHVASHALLLLAFVLILLILRTRPDQLPDHHLSAPLAPPSGPLRRRPADLTRPESPRRPGHDPAAHHRAA